MFHAALKTGSLIALLLMLPAGCRRASPHAAVPTGPRIVSTVPAATQILLQIGAGTALVGVSSFDKPLLPSAYRKLPAVGDYLNLDDELLLNLHPTILIIQKSPLRLAGLPALAAGNHIRLVNVSFNTIASLEKITLLLGKLANRQAAAEQAVTNLRLRLRTYARLRPARPYRPRVLFLVGIRPLRAVGRGNFMDSIIRLAGGINVGAKLGSGFPVLTHESMLELNPQIILLARPGAPPATGPKDPRIQAFAAAADFGEPAPRVMLITNPLCEMPTLRIAGEIKRLRRLFGRTAIRGVK